MTTEMHCIDPDKHFDSWSDFLSYYRSSFPSEEQWIFRGQKDARWSLSSFLERELRRLKRPSGKIRVYEAQILREFKRRVAAYDPAAPVADPMESLSYIQHYGGPTRLLDWTYSVYVAAFFALREAVMDGVATVWCFRTSLWDDAGAREYFTGDVFPQELTRTASYLQEIFGVPEFRDRGEVVERVSRLNPCVFQIAPYQYNLRIARQQGLFLIPSQIEYGFQDNLTAMLASNKGRYSSFMRRLDLTCSEEFLREALTDLKRMGVTYEFLFGDPQSFCHDLSSGLLYQYMMQDKTGRNPPPAGSDVDVGCVP